MALVEPRRADDSGAVTATTAAGEKDVEALIAAIHADDADGIAGVFDRLDTASSGPSPGPAIAAAVQTHGVGDRMLAALERRAAKVQTSRAWSQLAAMAFTIGAHERAVEAAKAALQRDPANADAALVLIVWANRRGEHEEALRGIDAVVDRVPVARDDPPFLLQKALAEVGRRQPQAALTIVDGALRQFTAAGFAFDAHVVRARALDQVPQRAADAIAAWRAARNAARQPNETDFASMNLIAALSRAGRADEGLRELDSCRATTADPNARTALLDIRPNILADTGDIDGAIAALEELLVSAQEGERRVQLRLRQARMAARARQWREAASRYDAAMADVAPPAGDRRREVQLEKAQVLAPVAIDLVVADLDNLDATWTAPGWPAVIDLRLAGLLAAGRADEAASWLANRLAGTPALAAHPAALQARGNVDLARREIDSAVQCFRRAVELGADASEPRALSAVMISAHTTQKYQAAVTAFRRLMEVDKSIAAVPDLRVIAANAHLRQNDLEPALALLHEPQPTSLPMAALGIVVRGEILVGLGRTEEALAVADEALQRLEAKPPLELPPEAVVALHMLRAQIFNQRKNWTAARQAASAAIDVPETAGAAIENFAAFVRIAAYTHRSLARFRLNDLKGAHADLDAALAAFDRLRGSTMVRLVSAAPEFGGFEASLWLAKGRVFDAGDRSEEALAAYTRAELLESDGNEAAVARGHALAATGAFVEAVAAFDSAVTDAATPVQRADALTGKGRALIRLARYDAAIGALQAALDARLGEPDDDPGVFELLGIAYDALQRRGAAKRAFRRAWNLTPTDKRGANLARGVSAAELRLGDPAAALEFLDKLPPSLKDDRTLLFNRALALDALGKQRDAIGCLVRARKAGLDKAQAELDRLDAPAGLGRWTHHWFGAQAGPVRRAWGIALLVVASAGLVAPLLQWRIEGKFEVYLALLPSLVALVLLALPNMKSITVDAGKVKVTAEPLPAMGRDVPRAAPEDFKVPVLAAVSISVAETRAASGTPGG